MRNAVIKQEIRRFTRVVATAALVALGTGAVQAADLRSWDQQINDSNKRFVVLAAFKGEAVLDKETQLVWQRSPSQTPVTFQAAREQCMQAGTGGRMGWRLPSLVELRTLIDPSLPDLVTAALPVGHPFNGVLAPTELYYWTSTMNPSTGARAAAGLNGTSNFAVWALLTSPYGKWCVRGAAATDG